MKKFSLIVTCAFGLESCVKRELIAMGYDRLRVSDGAIELEGDERDIARLNLWLRCGSRVLIKLALFKALTFEDLFQGTFSVNWQDMIPIDGNFIISGRSARSQLSSVPACQKITEKAVVEKLKTKYPIKYFPKTGAVYNIQIALHNDTALLTLDTSGVPLYRRGYRKAIGQAPLKETMAASLVSLSFWKSDRLLTDPCCGSGTILIEAALMARNIAPGLYRGFAFENWSFTDGSHIKEERLIAKSKIKRDFMPRIFGSDIDPEVIKLAKENAQRAGVADCISFSCKPLGEISLKEPYGICICNPPYADRMGSSEEAEALYKDIGKIFISDKTWSTYVLTSHEGFERICGRRADKRRKLFNGNIKTDYYQFFGERPPKAEK